MGDFGSEPFAFIVTLSLGLYFCVIFVQLSLLGVDGYMSKWELVRSLIPALCKNVGVGCAIFGFTFHFIYPSAHFIILAAIGTLLIPIGLLLSVGKEIRTPPALETALTVVAILSLGSLFILNNFV